jgi:hypothetical protein
MNPITLTPEELAQVDAGKRLFVVEEIPGPMWQVVSISRQGHEIPFSPPGAPGFEIQREARATAAAAVNASKGSAWMRPIRHSYEVELRCLDDGYAWRLRKLRDGLVVGVKIFPLPDGFADAQQAFQETHDEALRAGEQWLRSVD